jgi:hypothetical protein
MVYLVTDENGQILVLKATDMKEGNDEAIEKTMFLFLF